MSLSLSTRHNNSGYYYAGAQFNNVNSLSPTGINVTLPFTARNASPPVNGGYIELPISDIVMAYFGVKVWTLTTPLGSLDIDISINNTNGSDFSAYSFYGQNPTSDPLLPHVKESLVCPLFQFQTGGVSISGTGGTGQTFSGNWFLRDEFSFFSALIASSTPNQFLVTCQVFMEDTNTGGQSDTFGPGFGATGTMFFMSGSQTIYAQDGGGIGVPGDCTLQPKTFW